MFSEVNIEVQDGNLGRNTSTGSFVHVKIGASTSDKYGASTCDKHNEAIRYQRKTWMHTTF